MVKSQLKNGQFSLKPAVVKKIINAAESPRDRLVIELLYYCGLRRSEVVKIQTGDIDFKACRLRVRGKGNKERLVPIPPDVVQNIKFFLGKTARPYLFPARRKSRAPLVSIMINRIVDLAAKAAGVTNPNPRHKAVNPHLLRHSAARRLKDAGVRIEVISAFLGHENTQITAEIYGLMAVDEILDQVGEILV